MTEIETPPELRASPPLSTPWVPMWPLAPSTLGELAYAERTTPINATATTEATAEVFVTAPAITCDGATPVVIEFYAPYVQTPSGSSLQIYYSLFDGEVSLGNLGTTFVSSGSVATPVLARRRFTPSAGVHTYSIRIWGSIGGAKHVGAGPGGPTFYAPASIRISLAAATAAPVSNPTYGTSFPAAPANGQEHILVDSVSDPGYQWRFRYNASSTSPYKWEFIGGAPYFAITGQGTGEAVTAPGGAWGDLATVGPRLLVPREGIYEGHAIVQCASGAAARHIMQVALWVGTASTSGLATATASDATDDYRTLSIQDKPTIPAGSDIRVRYSGSVGDQFFNRSLRVVPVRVS